jgi:hypothetical protein
MTTRFCPGCRAEVEDTGGFCLLGHRLALEPPVASLSALREEVDSSFDDSAFASVDFADDRDEAWDRTVVPAMAGAVRASPAVPAGRVAPPPASPPQAAPVRPVSPPATPTRRVPPPPPPPQAFVPSPSAPPTSPPPPPPAADRTFAAIIPPNPTVLPPNPASPAARDDSLAGDPITAFAPAPRMDWGPERGRLRRLRLRSRRSESDE